MKERASKFLTNPAIVTLVVLAVVALGATSAYMVLEGWDFLTALIFTLATANKFTRTLWTNHVNA